ncbi:hypothetical protein KP509_27G058100 [Ceratopteris richardii]|nr:hypothetical protein KP509_27G058100 [Ceratopteris richardii]
MCFQTLSTWAPTHEILEEPKQNVDSPSSASVIAAAMNAVGHSNINFLQKLDKQPRGVFSGPSKDFLELCQQQLAICDSLFGRKAKLTVYIRPVESYGTPDLELRRVAAHPKWTMGDSNETLVLVGNYGAAGVLRSTESALLAKEVMELPDFNALVLPMVKDLFLVGVLVAEGNVADVEPVSKGNKLRSGEPEWTTQDDGLDSQEHERDLRTGAEVDCTPLLSNDSSSFTSEQKFEGRKIAQSLAIACVMDQRTLLLHQSSWQRGVRVGDLLEQVRGPLAAIRTLGKMLQPQMKKGEISTDILEDILVQGDQIKNVVQQFHELIYFNESPPTLHHNKENENRDSGLLTGDPLTRSGQDGDSAVHDGVVSRYTDSDLNPDNSVSHSSKRDEEAPMPPLALAALPDSTHELCDVLKTLSDLVNSGVALARRKGQTLELKQRPTDGPFYAAIDEYSLRQAFSNLIDSSLQHILPGGWVKVKVMQAPGGGVLVIIEDNGPDYTLLSQAQALAPLGSGLQVGTQGAMDTHIILSIGAELSIAQEILEEFGGVLRIRSPYLPKSVSGMGGTRLEVWLPSPPLRDENS